MPTLAWIENLGFSAGETIVLEPLGGPTVRAPAVRTERPPIYVNVKSFRECVIAFQQVVTALNGQIAEAASLNQSLLTVYNSLDSQDLLCEDGSVLLLEDDMTTIITGAVDLHTDAFLLETDDTLLLEDGHYLLVEDGRYTTAIAAAQADLLYLGVGGSQDELRSALLTAPPLASAELVARLD